MLKTLIFLAFVVITIVGWLVQFINSQNHPPPPNRRRKENDPASGKVRNEIEQFLEEARRSRQGLPPREQANAGRENAGIEVVEAPRRPPAQQKNREEIWREQTQTRRQPQQQASRPAQQPQPQRRPAKKPPKQVSQQAKPAPSRPAPQGSLARQSDIGRHVQQQMAERIGQGVAAHLPHAIDSNVQSHLGKFTADAEDSLGNQGFLQTKIRRSAAAGSLRQLLTSKQGVRNAILINEILGPPLAKRRRS